MTACDSCVVLYPSVQFKDFIATYNQVTQNCFEDCVNDFTSRRVTKEEVGIGYSTGAKVTCLSSDCQIRLSLVVDDLLRPLC